MDSIKNIVIFLRSNYFNKEIKDILLMSAMCFICVCLVAYGFYESHQNNQALQIVKGASFVGEVISKNKSESPSSSFILFKPTYYRMHIIGEYISDDNEVVRFDKKLSVPASMYNLFETGDIISNE